MRNLNEKIVDLSILIGNQFPSFVSENNRKFINFLSTYYESLETKYQPLDIIANLFDYYNIKNYTATDLVESTKLTADVSLTDYVLNVESTKGFPETNGYIKVNGEIVFYRTKTLTSFEGCVRGTSAFMLETVPSTNVILTNSEFNTSTKGTIHEHNVDDSVENIAFTFTSEFLRRITAEISPNLPKTLVSDLNLTNFLSQIKSFYTSKGSLNSHKILFRILFNDKKIKIRVKNRGRGAKIVLTNYSGGVGFELPPVTKTAAANVSTGSTKIYLNSVDGIEVNDQISRTSLSSTFQPETIVIAKNTNENSITINYPTKVFISNNAQLNFTRIVGYSIVDGGEDYDNRKDSNGNLINPPIIEVIGSGYGIKNANTNIIPQTAIVKVTDIDSNGSITQISIFNRGTDYIGPITGRVRERTFNQDQIVTNLTNTGSGRVEFWDASANELTLYNTVGYFKIDDQLIGDGFENPQAFISKAYPRTDINRKGNPSVQVLSLDPEIEFPKDYTLKPSSSVYKGKKIIHGKISKNSLYKNVNNTVVVPRLLSLVQQSDLESGIKGCNLEVTDYSNITQDIYEFSIESNSDYKNLVSVPSTRVVIEKSVEYDYFYLTLSTIPSLTVDDATGFPLTNGYIFVENKILKYSSRSSNQFFNCEYIGSDTESFTIPVNADVYAYGRDRVTTSYTLGALIKEGDYTSANNNVYVAVNSGVGGLTVTSLDHTSGIKEVGGILWQYVGPNLIKYFIDVYIDGDFTEPYSELIPLGLISDITITNSGSLYNSDSFEFSSVLKNKDHSPVVTSWNVTPNTIISNNSVGIHSVYKYGDHAYVTSSGIPPYLNSVVGRNSCTNQKLLRRILRNVEKGKGVTRISKKNIGITVDGVEIQSARGNVINYGRLEKIYIGNGGNYKVPISSSGGYVNFNYTKYPVILVEGTTSILSNTSNNTLFYISSSLTSVDITKLSSSYLTGYTSTPVIEIINNNPSISKSYTETNLDTFFSIININNHGFKVGDKITYTSSVEEIGELKNNFIYYVGDVTTNAFRLYFTKDDAVLSGNNFVSFRNNYTVLTVSGKIATDIRNPDNFEPIDLDLSYNQTTKTIDNIIIKNPGKGYLNAPTIRITAGGKAPQVLPLSSSTGDIFVFRGELISAQNFDSDNTKEINVSGLITTTFKTTPKLTISAGSNASFTVFTSNGRISSVPMNNFGSYYFTEPSVVVEGIGSGAVLKAINSVSTGRVNSIEIINPGSGYSIAPVVRIVPSGSGGNASAELKSWTFNLTNQLTIDNYGGYIFNSSDDDPKPTSTPNDGLLFAQLIKDNIPSALDDAQYLILKTTSTLNSYFNVNSLTHSSIIGWAYDGNPIYGKYAYSSNFDFDSTITAMTTSWRLKTSRTGGPTTSQYPLGTFIEDYEYVAGLGTLDEYNGRYCVTPEFPNGTYAYFATDAFPFFIGLEYYSSLDTFNLCTNRLNDKVPSKFVRVNQETPYYPKEYKNLSRTIVTPGKVSSGGVEKIIIENSGDGYKIGDTLIVNNRETKGTGAAGYVSRLNGKQISNYVLLSLQSNGITTNYVQITTSENHKLAVLDTIYIDFKKNSSVFQNITLQGSVVNLNRSENTKIVTQFATSARFYYDVDGQLPFMDSDIIEILPDGIKIITDNIPEILYLFINNSSYEVKTSSYALEGSHEVVYVVNDNTFRILKPTEFDIEGLDNIFYTTDSFNATGGIYSVTVSNKGSNYIALPEIEGVESASGYGALMQFDSNSIGKLSKFNYSIVGEKFISNKTINYDLQIPSTAKIINNYEIYEVEVLYGGFDYISTDNIKVNGVLNSNYEFNIISNRGTIISVEVINGGSFLNEIPTLTIDSLTGADAILKAKVRRKKIFANDIIQFGTSSSNKAIVKSFNDYNSTVQFELISGYVKENDIIYTVDGTKYGNIVNIRNASAFAKSHTYSSIQPKFLNNSGFLDDSTQKLLDSNYYQDWSYILSSQQNIKDWKTEVQNNTHAAGFKLFGKKIIQTRKSRFERTEDIVKSSVVFSANFWSKYTDTEKTVLDLSLDLSTCNQQYVAINNITGFNVGDYVYGAASEARGKISSIEENYMDIQLLSNIEFEIGEYISTVSIDFINGIDEETKSSLLFYTGILQQPYTAYSVSNLNIIPRFNVNPEDELALYTIQGKFDILDIYTANSGNFIPLKINGLPFTPANKQHLLISVNGIIQNTQDITLSGNTITISEQLDRGSKCFILHRDTLKSLTVTTVNSTTYTINYTPTNSSHLILFVRGVGQSHLLTDYTLVGNTITLSESITGEIFGWVIDEPTTAQQILAADLNNRRILDSRNCTIARVTEFIESSKIDYEYDKSSILELEKEIIDGTLVSNSDNTTVHGFDTKFKVTTPEYSSSYVEVLDPIIFNGVSTSFTLKYADGKTYTPKNGKDSIIVNVNNEILSSSQYSVSGSTITFTSVYSSLDYCVVTDFISSHSVNDSGISSARLDALDVVQNGTRKTFNLSYKGVPQYVRNITDIFTIKNNLLLTPASATSHTVSNNKITLTAAPQTNDSIKLVYFNRQLGLTANTNLVVDPIQTFDGNDDTFPLTIDGLLFSPVSVYNLYVVRAGVYQRPNIDYTVSGTNITFNDAPFTGEQIIIFYSYNNLNANQYIADFISDGTSSTVDLGLIPPNEDDLFVLRNGVFQNPLVDFTLSGSNLTFTTALQVGEPIFIMYTTASIKIGVSSYTQNTIILNSTDYTNYINGVQSEIESMVLYANGVPKFYGIDYTISGTTITLLGPEIDSNADVFVIKYPNMKIIDDIEYFPDGNRTRFKLLTNGQNLNAAEILTDADILITVNGVVKDPGTEYNINVNRTFIEFTTAPDINDVIVAIKMNNNNFISISPYSGNTYTLSSAIPTAQLTSFVVFSNNTWKFLDNNDFTFSNNNTRITLTSAHTTGKLFGIIFDGDFKYLDQINTPFNGANTKFNMFISEENYIPNLYPPATYPASSSILLIKNNKLLDPGIDYTLTGTIGSQITFTTAPVSTDVIEVRTLGYFQKLTSITSGINGNTTFNLTFNSSTYYPNELIERPRKHENQILVIKDGSIQSPLTDYYVDENKIVFVNPITGNKLVILDYIGTYSDVEVIDTTYNIEVGDKIQLSGEYNSRVVTEIITPTLLKTELYTGRKPSGFSGFATVNSTTRKITALSITSGGSGYSYPVILRTKGIGISAKGIANVNSINGYSVTTPVTIQYPGVNIFGTPVVMATTYGYTFKKKVLESSSLSISTMLSASLNTTSESISVKNASKFPQNPPTVTVYSLLGYPNGSGAEFRVFVSKNRIRKVTVINGGSGYSEKYTMVELTGGNGFGCVLVPTINTTTGAITSISVKNGGENYDTFKAIIYDDADDINFEVIEYTYSSTTDLLGCTRSTTPLSHDINSKVYSDDYL